MAIILQDPRNIGYNLGTGLSQGLSALAHNKLNQIAFSKLGVPQREAQGLAALNPQIQQSILKAYLEGYQPQQQEQLSLEDLLQSLQPEQQEQNILQSLNLPNRESSVDFLNNINTEKLKGILGKDAESLINQTLSPQKSQISVAKESNKTLEQPLKPSPEIKKIDNNLSKNQRQDFLSTVKSGLNRQEELKKQLADRKEDRRDAREERKLQFKEELTSNAETKELYDDLINQYAASKDSDRRLARMQKLIQEGNLASPFFVSALKPLSIGGFGIDLTFLKPLLNPESQEFEKLSNDFIKDAKSLFGGRVTDQDLKSFLTTVPTLLQSDEGKVRVIRNLTVANEAKKVKYNALKEILKETGGKRPRDLAIRIDERAGEELDRLADEFINYQNPSEERPSIPARIGQGALDLLHGAGKAILRTQI